MYNSLIIIFNRPLFVKDMFKSTTHSLLPFQQHSEKKACQVAQPIIV